MKQRFNACAKVRAQGHGADHQESKVSQNSVPGFARLARTPSRAIHIAPLPARRWKWLASLSQLICAGLTWWLGWRIGCAAFLLSHGALIIPIFLPRARLYAAVVSQLPADVTGVWLTIDDGPSADTLEILNLLRRFDARATFFLVGQRAAERPDLVAAIHAAGHTIGNHSYSHSSAWFWAFGPKRMAQEIAQTQRILTRLIGTAPVWFRSVVGMTNPWVARCLQQHGLTRVAWTTRGFDGVVRQPQAVLRHLQRGLKVGAIILLHEGHKDRLAPLILQSVLEQLHLRQCHTLVPTIVPGHEPMSCV